MNPFDLVIRGGTVATAADTYPADVGIRDGRIVALAHDLGEGDDEIDATGKLVLPGGIDSHCHIEQMSAAGVLCADDFYSGSVSAAFGGTTTIIPLRSPAPRAVVARGGRGVPRLRGPEGGGGLRLPPHHLRPQPRRSSARSFPR